MGPRHSSLDTPLFHIGTSGWQYNHWKGVFYPATLRTNDRLQFYAQHLSTLELNVTFYRTVPQATFQKWYDTVPPRFLFSVKMSRFITHIKRLKIDEASIHRFMEDVGALKEKLGVILIQLPPSLKFDHALMNDFFSLLDPTYKYTVEARSETFVNDQCFALLESRKVAWCIADSGGRYPYNEAVTAPFIYIRLHGSHYSSNYSDKELQEFAAKIRKWARGTYVYFDNDVQGYAVKNAITLAGMLTPSP